MTDFATLSMRIDSSQAAAAKRSLDALPASAGRAEQAVDRLGAASGRTGAQMQRLGPGIQQAGYQIGDFAVQVASGQSAMIALTQQGSQLLGAFGPWGAVLGAAGAVVGALATGMMNASGEGRTFAETMDDLSDAIARSKDASDLARGSMAALKDEFGFAGAGARDLARAFERISLRRVMDEAEAARAALLEVFEGSAWLNTSRAENLGSSLGFNTRATNAMVADEEAIKNAETLGQRLEAIRHYREHFLELAGDELGMTQERLDHYTRIVDLLALTERAAERLKDAEREGTAEIARQYQIGADRQRYFDEHTKSAEALLVSLRQQAEVGQLVLRFGEDSHRVTEARAAAAREAFVAETEARDISEDLKRELIEAWDATNGIASAADRIDFDRAARAAAAMAAEVERAVAAAEGISSGAAADLAREQLRSRYAKDPVKLAGELEALDFDLRTGPINDPILGLGLAEQRAQAVQDAMDAERLRQDRLAADRASRDAARGSSRIDPLTGSTASAEERIAQMRMEATLVGQSEEAQSALRRAYEESRLEADLLADAKKTGNVVTAEEAAQIERTVDAYAAAAAELDRLTLTQKAQEEAAKEAANANRELFNGFSSAIQQAEDLEEALRRVGLAMIDMLARGALLKEGPFASIGSALTSAIGGGFSAGASLPGGGSLVSAPAMPQMYASGTNFHPGGLAIVGEEGPELLDLPRGSRVTPNDRLQAMADGAAQRVLIDLEVFVNDGGKLDAIAQQAGGAAGAEVAVKVTQQAMRPRNFAAAARNAGRRTA